MPHFSVVTMFTKSCHFHYKMRHLEGWGFKILDLGFYSGKYWSMYLTWSAVLFCWRYFTSECEIVKALQRNNELFDLVVTLEMISVAGMGSCWCTVRTCLWFLLSDKPLLMHTYNILVAVNQNQFAFSFLINEKRKAWDRWWKILLWRTRRPFGLQDLLLLPSSVEIQTRGMKQIHVNTAFMCMVRYTSIFRFFKRTTKINK